MNALATRPDDLRAAAQLLAGTQDVLDALERVYRASHQRTCQDWSGSAAMGHRLRVDELTHATRRAAEQLGAVQRALRQAAHRCETELGVIRRLSGELDQLHREASRLRLMPLDPGDLLGAAARAARLAELDDRCRSVSQCVEQAKQRLEDALDAAAGTVRSQTWLDTLTGLKNMTGAMAKELKGGRLVVGGAAFLALSVQHALSTDLAAKTLLVARMELQLKVLLKPPPWAKILGRLSPLAIPLTVIADGISDTHDGGGYEGWRGTVTRVTAAAAIPGSVLMVIPSGVPQAVGAITVGSYYLWKGGNALYDNPEPLIDMARFAYAVLDLKVRELKDLTRYAGPVLRSGGLGLVLPGLGPLGVWVGDRAADLGHLGQIVVEAVPDSSHWADDLPHLPSEWLPFVRQLGEPFRLPTLPIGPGPRLPVLPPFSPGLPFGIWP